jgi:hypothetical protein
MSHGCCGRCITHRDVDVDDPDWIKVITTCPRPRPWRRSRRSGWRANADPDPIMRFSARKRSAAIKFREHVHPKCAWGGHKRWENRCIDARRRCCRTPLCSDGHATRTQCRHEGENIRIRKNVSKKRSEHRDRDRSMAADPVLRCFVNGRGVHVCINRARGPRRGMKNMCMTSEGLQKPMGDPCLSWQSDHLLHENFELLNVATTTTITRSTTLYGL